MTEPGIVSSRPGAVRGDYGYDGWLPGVVALGAGGCLLLALAATSWARRRRVWPAIETGGGLVLLFSMASYLYTTRAGKLRVWVELLHELELVGNEHVLDMGCGRGAVLLLAAKLVPRGRAVGIDVWRSVDQSGNSPDVTRRNAELEGVSEHTEVHTGDVTAMPFENATFDLVLSSLTIHNIRSRDARRKAIDEAIRVLRPGGRLAIADIRFMREYRDWLSDGGMIDVKLRSLDWRFWYGGPWLATRLVKATKPSAWPSIPPD